GLIPLYCGLTFIDGRLAKLNAGRGFTDVFEEEITEGGFCGSEWSKAKSHAKRGIRDIKGRLKARVSNMDLHTFLTHMHTLLKHTHTHTNLSQAHRYPLPSPHRNRQEKSVTEMIHVSCNHRISSEDSGEVHSYIEDSDDSYSLDLDIDSSNSGQMNLLEEILDSLNTTTVEQGKLSAAKSLDFFRSMDDLDYIAPVLICARIGSGGDGDPGGWNMGQDDSAVHGKHLPPSPRRQPNKSSMKVSKNHKTAPPPPDSSTVPGTGQGQDTDVSKVQSHLHQPTLEPAPQPLPPGRQQGNRFSYSPSMSHKVTPTLDDVSSSHHHVSLTLTVFPTFYTVKLNLHS
uniref:DENN/MADD domain containing 1B n=1 Tax=Myripristis murdjan TaxID=586833 RepID=A0A667XM44_9TELE